jgi:HSP20 family protein
MKKPSFFDRFTGSDDLEGYDDLFEDDRSVVHEHAPEPPSPVRESGQSSSSLVKRARDEWMEQEQQEGDLGVDVYQTDDAIVVKAFIAGVPATNISIDVTRDMLTIEGSREDEREVNDDKYFQKELYWGAFSRTILLPEEVDVDQAEATEKHGILIIRLPKVNKTRATKLKVRSR